VTASQTGSRRANDQTDGRLARGNHTRRLVLERTMEIASVEGLEALSIGRLATELQLSKSGVFALFGSKEEMQLATIRAASKVYIDHVIRPGLEVPAGAERIWTVSKSWFAYSRGRVFPGGCFFQRVRLEFGSVPGPVHDAILAIYRQWREFLAESVREAQQLGEINADEDAEQLSFEITALLEGANAEAVMTDTTAPYDQARSAIRSRLLTASGGEPDFLRAAS
jgi:AcrR family transcriptional regulator